MHAVRVLMPLLRLRRATAEPPSPTSQGPRQRNDRLLNDRADLRRKADEKREAFASEPELMTDSATFRAADAEMKALGAKDDELTKATAPCVGSEPAASPRLLAAASTYSSSSNKRNGGARRSCAQLAGAVEGLIRVSLMQDSEPFALAAAACLRRRSN